MDSRLVVVIAAFGVLGLVIRARLRTGSYRRPDEGGPLPRHLWVVAAAPFAAALVALGLADRPWPVLLPHLTLVGVGLALAAIDADVHRLPNTLTLPLIPVTLVLLTVASAVTGDWAALGRAGLAQLLVGGGCLALALGLPGRSIGLGDAKLMLSLAPALGWLSWLHVIGGLWLGVLIGGIVSLGLLLTQRATLATRVAFGPYLVAGALLAVAFG